MICNILFAFKLTFLEALHSVFSNSYVGSVTIIWPPFLSPVFRTKMYLQLIIFSRRFFQLIKMYRYFAESDSRAPTWNFSQFSVDILGEI